MGCVTQTTTTVNEATNSYSVQEYPRGVAVFGWIPVDDLIGLMKSYEKRGYDKLFPGIATAIGASMVFADSANGKAWSDEIDAAAKSWLKSTDVGVSSKVIFRELSKQAVHIPYPDVPHDPADFGRCYRLLEKFPGWRERLGEVVEQYPEWGPMVREWDRMTTLYERDLESGLSGELYALMQSLEKEGRAKTK